MQLYIFCALFFASDWQRDFSSSAYTNRKSSFTPSPLRSETKKISASWNESQQLRELAEGSVNNSHACLALCLMPPLKTKALMTEHQDGVSTSLLLYITKGLLFRIVFSRQTFFLLFCHVTTSFLLKLTYGR